MNKPDKNNIGNTGEYYAASILSSKGYVTTITLGRAEKYDLITIRPDGKTIKIQVKTSWNGERFTLSSKNESDISNDFFYIFVNLKENKELWDYFIFPSKIVAKHIREINQKWLETLGRNNKKHDKNNKIRTFFTKINDKTPDWYTEKLINKHKNNLKILEQ